MENCSIYSRLGKHYNMAVIVNLQRRMNQTIGSDNEICAVNRMYIVVSGSRLWTTNGFNCEARFGYKSYRMLQKCESLSSSSNDSHRILCVHCTRVIDGPMLREIRMQTSRIHSRYALIIQKAYRLFYQFCISHWRAVEGRLFSVRLFRHGI